jgi:hypothetical protein
MPRKRPRNPGGRPTKYTAARVLRLVSAIAEGKSRAAAAEAAGIGETTLERWLTKGRSGHLDFAPLVKVVGQVERAQRLDDCLLFLLKRPGMARSILR